MNDMTFAERLKSARLAAGLTQAAMASVTAIPKRNIEDWETARSKPPVWAQRYILDDLENRKKSEKSEKNA